MAVEEPAFRTVVREGAFEIRDYPALVVAEVTVTGDQKEAAGKGFRLLAGYIFGGNRRKQSIAMTAPVAQEPVSETIAMTAPVTQTKTAGRAAIDWRRFPNRTIRECTCVRRRPPASPRSDFRVSPGRTMSQRRPPSCRPGCSSAICARPVPPPSRNIIRPGRFGFCGETK